MLGGKIVMCAIFRQTLAEKYESQGFSANPLAEEYQSLTNSARPSSAFFVLAAGFRQIMLRTIAKNSDSQRWSCIIGPARSQYTADQAEIVLFPMNLDVPPLSEAPPATTFCV
jgi:hypothetical protein